MEGVSVLDGADLANYLGILAARIAESKMQMDLRRWWENSKVYGEIILWVSVVITETEKISGGPLSITKYTLNMEGPVIIIHLKNGEVLMLTPEQAEDFAELLKSRGAADIDASYCIASIPLPSSSFDREGNIKKGRRRRIISLVMFFVIAGAVLGWFFLTGPGSEGYVPKAAAVETEAEELEQTIVPQTFGAWDSDKLFVFVVPASKGSERIIINSDFS
ncbi:MAG TPA: hypothetical protein DCO79_02795 [Spirochaeta sp.]|nr:hypothetical protein [Spirochaeta sp.]